MKRIAIQITERIKFLGRKVKLSETEKEMLFIKLMRIKER